MNTKTKQYSELNLFEKIYIKFHKKYVIIGLIFIISYFIIDKLGIIFPNKLLIFRRILLDLIVLIYPILVYIHFYKVKILKKEINSSFINNNEIYLNYYKKNIKYLDFKGILLDYELQKANIELCPSKFIAFYENKLNNNEFLAINNYKSKINCFLPNYKNYMVLYYINNIILQNEIKSENYFNNMYNKVVSIFDLIKNNNNNTLKKRIFLNIFSKIKFIYFIMIIHYYNNKDYTNLYNLLKQYYLIYKYDLSKSILTFLYISAEKTEQEINFLPEITKQKMYETIEEDEFKQFIEKELS